MVHAPNTMFENTVEMLQSREEGGAEGRLGRWILELVTAISLRG